LLGELKREEASKYQGKQKKKEEKKGDMHAWTGGDRMIAEQQ
jgi:hypothetical protein